MYTSYVNLVKSLLGQAQFGKSHGPSRARVSVGFWNFERVSDSTLKVSETKSME